MEKRSSGDLMNSRPTASRPTRSRLPLAHPVCRTVEKWTTLDNAVDIFGNQVRVLHKFSQDNAFVEQNFYERYCETDGDESSKGKSKTLSMDESSGGSLGLNKCYGVDEGRHH
jgi:hypothetical protein